MTQIATDMYLEVTLVQELNLEVSHIRFLVQSLTIALYSKMFSVGI
jgi:hypothetical protein